MRGLFVFWPGNCVKTYNLQNPSESSHPTDCVLYSSLEMETLPVQDSVEDSLDFSIKLRENRKEHPDDVVHKITDF